MWRPRSVHSPSDQPPRTAADDRNYRIPFFHPYRQSGGHLIQNCSHANVPNQWRIPPEHAQRLIRPYEPQTSVPYTTVQHCDAQVQPIYAPLETVQSVAIHQMTQCQPVMSSQMEQCANMQQLMPNEGVSPANVQQGVTGLRDDPFTPDQDGDLPLHIAVAKEDPQQVYSLLQLMQQHGYSVDFFNNLRQTPLHLAVITRNAKIVRMLLSNGASPAITDRHGNTSLHLAAQLSSKECLVILFDSPQSDAIVNSLNYEGLSPLHLAALRQDREIIKELVCRNADVDAVDGKSGRTALFHSVENELVSSVELLITLGASVNLANYSGVTPLIAATDRGNKTITSMLISRGAMITSRFDS